MEVPLKNRASYSTTSFQLLLLEKLGKGESLRGKEFVFFPSPCPDRLSPPLAKVPFQDV